MKYISRRFLTRLLAGAIAPIASKSAEALTPAISSFDRLEGQTGEVLLSPSGGDDTPAILRAMTAAASGRPLRFGPGTFSFEGLGVTFSGNRFVIRGLGASSTTIELGPESYFIHSDQPIHQCLLEGLRIVGGRGAFCSSWAGINVSERKIFRNNVFVDYTECAIQNNGADEPYWIIESNTFDALNSTGTIGVALAQGCDNSQVARNAFLRNRIHVKARHAGISTKVYNNDFLFFDGGSPLFPRAAIWLVPHPSWVNAGVGCVVSQNKFGNENQSSMDYRIIFVDEASSTNKNGRIMPALNEPSTGYVDGHMFTQNKISGGYPISFIYSTTMNLRNQIIFGNAFDGTMPSEIIQFLTPLTADRFNQSNCVGLNTFGTAAVNSTTPVVSMSRGAAAVLDPFAVFEADPRQFHTFLGGCDRTGFQLLLSSDEQKIETETGELEIVDALGGRDAWTTELEPGRKIRLSNSVASVLPGEATWIEFDLLRKSEIFPQLVDVAIVSSHGAVHWQRKLYMPENGWRRYRFPFVFREQVTSFYFELFDNQSLTALVGIGRVRIYHAREPVNFDKYRNVNLDLSNLPSSPEGLRPGEIWVDGTRGNVLRRV